MGLVTLQSVTIGAALLLICCGDPEAKARRLLNQAQVLEREGKEQERAIRVRALDLTNSSRTSRSSLRCSWEVSRSVWSLGLVSLGSFTAAGHKFGAIARTA